MQETRTLGHKQMQIPLSELPTFKTQHLRVGDIGLEVIFFFFFTPWLDLRGARLNAIPTLLQQARK